MGTVLFLTSASRGDALKMMGRSYQAFFNEEGYDFLEIDFREQARAAATLNQVLAERPIEFAFSYMGCGSNITASDENGQSRNLWQAIGAPFLALLGDSPAYFFDLHVANFPNFACLYGFPEHEVLRRRLPKADGFIGRTRSLPLDPQRFEDLDFKTKARGELLFLKNGNDPKKLWESWSALKAGPLRALHELASHLGSDLTNSAANQIDDVVTEYFASSDFDLSTMPRLRLFFIAQLDDYLRRLKSTMMAEALMDFPVRIIGVNWEHIDFSGKRATYIKECNYAESSGLIRDSLGVIDVSPNTGLAPHDRPCRAFGAHTLCLTNEQEFFRQSFPNFAAFSFRLDRESLRDKVADVLARPAHYVDVGIEVAAAYLDCNSPRAAVRHLIDTAAMIRLDQRRDRLPGSPDFFVWPPTALA